MIKTSILYVLAIISKGVMFVYSFPVFPVAYALRRPVRWLRKKGWGFISFPFWIVLNDENDHGELWWKNKHGGKENLITAWKWGWARNNSFNWNYEVIRFPMGDRTEIVKAKTNHDDSPMGYRHFKWELHRDGQMLNDGTHASQGDRLSRQHTRLGRSRVVFDVFKGGKRIGRYFRHSVAIIGNRWMYMFRYAISGRGEPIIDFKLKRRKDSYTAHWPESTKEIIKMSKRDFYD